MSFDVAELGLESHYNEQAQAKIKRLILEDWKEAGVKLPTYMKLVARFIEKTGVSEDWLSKLRHQTMDNMLKGATIPRYEFWACLHLYLSKKHGFINVGSKLSEDDIFGASFVRYGGAQSAPNTGEYSAGNAVIEIAPAEGKIFAYANVKDRENKIKDYSLDVQHPIKGVAIQQDQKVIAIMRDVITQEIKTWELEA